MLIFLLVNIFKHRINYECLDQLL